MGSFISPQQTWDPLQMQASLLAQMPSNSNSSKLPPCRTAIDGWIRPGRNPPNPPNPPNSRNPPNSSKLSLDPSLLLGCLLGARRDPSWKSPAMSALPHSRTSGHAAWKLLRRMLVSLATSKSDTSCLASDVFPCIHR
ncbi:hypothetical protein O181_096611 [Austropuccinia psidii MF-1]|uniref:Uncharacterized protein n=1 Tax=Austropuccinia psidii MF-1 TaxID=1389203 RepID=A0A9Q3PED0_9BASI|nr:hypothetical protein [Austropuccinia psidii MF-1]